VRGSNTNNQYEEALDFWGAPKDDQPDTGPFEIDPENWDTVQLFVKLQTQWRLAPTGHRTGLDYTAIGPTAQYMGLTVTPDVFDGLQFMEIVTINEIFRHANRPK
jgi:hypothetical protein